MFGFLLQHFRTLDYSKTKNRKDLIDTFIYRVLLYDNKMKVIFNLKKGQQNELLLNLIFPDYPDGNDGENENSAKEKETDNSVSNSEGCAYTPVMVDESGLAPESYELCQSFLHTYSAFNLTYPRRRTGANKRKPLKYFFKRAVKRLKKFAV